MTRLPVVTGREAVAAFKKAGFYEASGGGLFPDHESRTTFFLNLVPGADGAHPQGKQLLDRMMPLGACHIGFPPESKFLNWRL